MKRLAQFTVLAFLLGMLGFWVASAQSSVELISVDKAGWWTRRPAAQPAGGGTFEVAAGVQGEESVAALRVLIHGEITKATLVLAELDAPLAPVNPGALQVCTTNVPWLYVDGGKYDDAPKPDCSHAIPLTRQADPTGVGSWTADVTPLLAVPALSETSLMIVPVIDKTAVVPPTYYIKMSARVVAEGTPDITSPAVVAAPPPPASSPAATPTAPRPSASPAATPTATPAATPDTTATTTPTSQPRRFAPVSSHAPSKPWGKLVVLIPLAAIFGAAYVAAQRYATDRSLVKSH